MPVFPTAFAWAHEVKEWSDGPHLLGSVEQPKLGQHGFLEQVDQLVLVGVLQSSFAEIGVYPLPVTVFERIEDLELVAGVLLFLVIIRLEQEHAYEDATVLKLLQHALTDEAVVAVTFLTIAVVVVILAVGEHQ